MRGSSRYVVVVDIWRAGGLTAAQYDELFIHEMGHAVDMFYQRHGPDACKSRIPPEGHHILDQVDKPQNSFPRWSGESSGYENYKWWEECVWSVRLLVCSFVRSFIHPLTARTKVLHRNPPRPALPRGLGHLGGLLGLWLADAEVRSPAGPRAGPALAGPDAAGTADGRRQRQAERGHCGRGGEGAEGGLVWV